ncbi:hypothetical protein AGLY_017781, partial [Aphis glycines]
KASTSPSQNSQSGKTNKVLVTSCPVTNNENLDEKSGALNQSLGQLVLVEYTNWKNAEKVFQNHCKLEYHINATLDAEHFINVLEKKEKSIIEQLDSDKIIQAKKNRKRLLPIIECILLCGRQELALRGHRGEKGNVLVDENAIQNAGNVRAILQFRAKGDTFLQNVLEETDTNIKYLNSLTGSDLSAAILNGKNIKVLFAFFCF